jgi:predicted nucleotidyltransferase
METIVKMIFGSHLYGTDTPDSDKDYKGVFLPSKEQVYLNKIPKSISTNTKKGNEKNTSGDTDTEMYSLQYFIKLACEGQTVALDMLHAPFDKIEIWSTLWALIIKERERFYTKNLDAFVGYARRQASKYGIKGSRLNDAKMAIDFFIKTYYQEGYSPTSLSYYWDELPTGEHIYKYENEKPRMYEVCGRKLQETVTIDYAYDVINKFYTSYGERARQAANNENIDWKAISHALRAAYQVKQILTENTITFPLKEAEFLKKVKIGELDYQTVVAPVLEELMDLLEKLSLKSILPEKVDRKYWDNFIINVMENQFGK